MKRRKVLLKDIITQHSDMDYQQFYAYVMGLIENKELEPMKSAKSNGRTPALPISFGNMKKRGIIQLFTKN